MVSFREMLSPPSSRALPLNGATETITKEGSTPCPPPRTRRNRLDPSAALHAESLGLARPRPAGGTQDHRGRRRSAQDRRRGAADRQRAGDERAVRARGRACRLHRHQQGRRRQHGGADRVRRRQGFCRNRRRRRCRCDRARGGALRAKTRRARRACAQCRHFLRAIVAQDDGRGLGPRLCGQCAQPHAVCAEGADRDGARRRDRADVVDGEPARQRPQPCL